MTANTPLKYSSIYAATKAYISNLIKSIQK